MTKTRELFGKVRLVKQSNGYNHALGIYGTAEDIQAVFMTLANSGVTGGELLDLGGETFAYVWTDSERFAYRLAQWEAGALSGQGMLPKRDKFEANEWFYNVWKFWADMFDAAEVEEFVPENATIDLACLSVGMDERPARLATCEE